MRLILSIGLCFLLCVAAPCMAIADKDYYDEWGVTCLIEINGEEYEVAVSINLKNPDKGDTVGHGTARNFNQGDSGVYCHGQLCEYTEVSIDHSWTAEADVPVEVDVGGGVIEIQSQTHTFTHAHNKAFWDSFYTGYTEPAACDYTQNCHGYAFEVGNVIEEVTNLTNLFPAAAGVGGGGAAPVPCYEVFGQDEKEEAEIACDVLHRGDDAHSIRVTPLECTPAPTVPQTFPAPPNYWIINESKEQFQESGTYTRSIGCPLGIGDLEKAHDETFKEHYKFLNKI